MSEHESETPPGPLLATKLHAPRRRGDVVHRERLRRLVDVAPQPAVTLVSAPAGFGKTTLVTEWLGDGDSATAWLSLDAFDSEPSVFWSYVIAALRTVAPDVGGSATTLLRESPPSLPAVVGALLNDVAALDDDIVLVLDDYHVIDSAEVHESVAFMIDHLPHRLRLVLATRADPPLPLARLRARGELLEIRAAHLRFTNDEASAYFNEAMGLELTRPDVDALETRTEGWIAALQLAALSIRGRDDVTRFIENFAGDDRFVVDYLVEEVLERQSVDIREFRTLVARAALERGQSMDVAIAFLQRLLAAAEVGGRTGSVIELLALLAAADHSNGDRSSAASALQRALEIGSPEGYTRVFLDVVPSLEPLLDTITVDGAARQHRQGVRGTASHRRTVSETELSPRERDVLRLLRSDLSGPEIARELHVSLNTLRTHTKSIFTKLAVTNRREAVRRAAELGL